MYRVIFLNINLQVTLDGWKSMGPRKTLRDQELQFLRVQIFSGLTDRFKISFTGCYDKANNKFA